ncbi:hypothetical protein HYH03_014612 [Edaphochlamys debaryana]|uniref:RING-type domain-containing protein n=1 Tax=Edaphochlamys debaryana TaxID=47281 RepID=A0A835XNM6_9CHLO|nr:hypothetical protein HYH03_014612 [Edaphochlamys debaryana]|eukprot:KAG2486682.1 hypothetical protein HYH03_014612 [Edaphochlamys debaryana]
MGTMRGLLGCALLSALAHGLAQQLRWSSPWVPAIQGPEPRSFASLAGLADATSAVAYLYGGFSHAQSAWTGDVWSLRLNESSPAWQLVDVRLGELAGTLQHATLVALGGRVLLVGGVYANGTINTVLYRLDLASGSWRRVDQQSAPAGPASMPAIFRHAALSYTVTGEERVLLCGGVGPSTTSNAVYELRYNGSTYSITTLNPMPAALFGHSLAAAPGSSTVFVSGGLPVNASGTDLWGIPNGLSGQMSFASSKILRLNRTGGDGGLGQWVAFNAMPRGLAFHASWVIDDRLYLFGGAQAPSGGAMQQGGLQVFDVAAANLTYNATVAKDVLEGQWRGVRPTTMSDAGTWVGNPAGTASSAKPSVWLFGGWATPQPLPASVDSYFTPQDSSLLWRLDPAAPPFPFVESGSGPKSGSGVWLSPIQGSMAPRSSAMVVPVTVAGRRMLLSLGGRAKGGWTGRHGSRSRFVSSADGLSLDPDTQNPNATVSSYHLYDMWLLDQATGARHPVWYGGSAAVPAGATCNASVGACTSVPFGSAASPVTLGPMWDRRLLEFRSQVVPNNGQTGAPGSSSDALYFHAVETPGPSGAPMLQTGVWRLSLSALNLTTPADAAPGAAGDAMAYSVTWTDLTPEPPTDVPACYPRILYGAAHLTSLSAAANLPANGQPYTYVGLHGGLVLSQEGTDPSGLRNMTLKPTDSVCMFDLLMKRWLQQPQYPAGTTPAPRYRHACAERPGVANYTMACYGGVSAVTAGSTASVLDDTWVFTHMPVVPAGPNQAQHVGSWFFAPANSTAVRPGPRADHMLVSVKGTNNTATVNPNWLPAYTPVILLGGSVALSSSAPAGPSPQPRADVWVLEAGCHDPEVSQAAPDAGPMYKQGMLFVQVWMNLIPNGTLGSAAAGVGLAATTWTVASAGMVYSEHDAELWVTLLASSGELQAVRMISPEDSLNAGCLSINPNCSRLSYQYDLVGPRCWPGSSYVDVLYANISSGSAPSGGLMQAGVGFVVTAADGTPLHYKNQNVNGTAYALYGLRLPDSVTVSDLTVKAYGKPGIDINSNKVLTTSPPSTILVFERANITATIRVSGSALVNATTELRVLYNGIYRKRRCPFLYSVNNDCDQGSTSASGVVQYDIFPIRGQAASMSYALIISPPAYYYNNFTTLLPTPILSGTAGANMSAGGGNVTLLPGGTAAYVIDVPPNNAPSPPPDGRVSVTITIGFRLSLGINALNVPASRRWQVAFYPTDGTNIADPVLVFNDTYSTSSKTYNKHIAPGTYQIEVADTLLPNQPMLEVEKTIEASTMPGSSSLVQLEVIFATVTFKVYYSRVVVSPGPGFYVGASSAQVSLYTIREDGITPAAVQAALTASSPPPANNLTASPSFGNGTAIAPSPTQSPLPPGTLGSYGDLWDYELTDGGMAIFSLIPSQKYVTVFSYPTMDLLGPLTIDSPPATGNSGGILLEFGLPQTLLCASGTTTLISQQRGRFPAENAGTVVYGPGTSCSWVITTGQPLMNLVINYTGLAPGDYITLTTDTGFITRLPTLVDQDSVFAIRMTASNVTLRFRANSDNLMGTGPIVSWEGVAQNSSMPPQFIMMIAASSAAAGAMLLFLCLWHCVFRPVQLRRQARGTGPALGGGCLARRRQAAAALAAATNAAAAGAGTGGARAGGHRNRVPRRYLRMMETSVFSPKDAAARAAAAAAAGTPAEGSSGVGDGSEQTADGASVKPAAAAAIVPAGAALGATSVRAPARVSGGGAPDAPVSKAAVAAPAVIGEVAVAPADDPSREGGAGNDASSGADAVNGEMCSICLCEFEDGERIKHLPCKHFYHVPCIDQWLGRDITCPLCKDNVLEAMRTLFGPLPPRNTSRRANATASGDGGGGGTQNGAAPAGDAAAIGAAATAGAMAAAAGSPNGNGNGPAAANGQQLELVVIVAPGSPTPNGAVAPPAAAGNTSNSLPGATGDSFDAAGVAGAGGVSSGGAGGPRELSGGGASSLGSTGGSAAAAAAAAAGGPQSRELRPMRRNLSHELANEQDGTSTDSDTDSDDDAGGSGSGSAGGAPAAAAASPASTNASPPPRPDRNQFLVAPPPLPPQPSGAGAGMYYEMTAIPPPAGSGSSPSRPVVEHVQHSQHSGSSSTSALRWMGGGGTQVMPAPPPPPGVPPPPAPPPGAAAAVQHRMPRAQEAQMAVAAAALSAVAAATAHSPHPPPQHHGALTAESSLASYRVHDNPLADADTPAPRAAPDSPAPGSPSAAHASGRSFGVYATPPASGALQHVSAVHPVSVHMSPPVGGHSSRGSVSSAGGAAAGPGAGAGNIASGKIARNSGALAVPDVSGGPNDDLLRTPSSNRSPSARGGRPGAAGSAGARSV